MLVWRNSLYNEDGSHAGFEWYSTPEAAETAAQLRSEKFRDSRARIAQYFETGHSKSGMVSFLNHVAGHPDNG